MLNLMASKYPEYRGWIYQFLWPMYIHVSFSIHPTSFSPVRSWVTYMCVLYLISDVNIFSLDCASKLMFNIFKHWSTAWWIVTQELIDPAKVKRMSNPTHPGAKNSHGKKV